MKGMLLATGVLVVMSASLASAAGINLSWSDCGLAGTRNTTFACTTNTGGVFTAVASFIPPAGVTQYLGLSSQIDIKTDSPVLPDWWQHGPVYLVPGCRGTTGLSVSFDFTGGPFTCFDFFSGQAAGGFAYDVGFGTPDRARFRIQCAVPFDNRGPVDAGTEFYAFKANLLRAKTTGVGSCAGCLTPACIVLNEIQLFQPPELQFDPTITNPAHANYVTWQSSSATIPPGCPLSTPTRGKTWGQVKSLYR